MNNQKQHTPYTLEIIEKQQRGKQLAKIERERTQRELDERIDKNLEIQINQAAETMNKAKDNINEAHKYYIKAAAEWSKLMDIWRQREGSSKTDRERKKE